MKGLEAKTLGLRKVIRHEYKRIVAFMLTVAMVVTNFGTNLTVAFAAGEEESSLFLLNSSELEDAISAALESGDVFDFSSLELKAKQKSLKTSYEKLIGSKAGKVYQLDVDIDSSYATEHTDLQVFYNAGTDDVVFLFINESDMAVTFRANVSGYETARVTVNPNTTNIEDAEGVENAEDYSGTTMVDDEKKPQAEVVKPEGETSEAESASDETEAAETEADVTESENASENGEAEETTGAEGTAETETSAAEETEAETEPETEAEAPAAEEAEEEIELTPEEGSASASISAKKVFRVSTSAEAAGEAPAADAEEETEAETETEAEEPEKETEAPAETTAEETIADETQADETTAADETDGELTEETEAPTEDVTAPDETTGEQPADNGGSENIGFDNDEQFLEDDSIELAGELNGKAYNTVTIWGNANARAYVVKAEDLTGEAAVEGQYSVDYSVDPVGAATIKGAHTVNEGETLYFAVDPQVGYEITEVTANGEPLEEADAADVASASDLEQHEHVYAVEAVTEDLEIVASLEETVGVAHPEFSASYVSSEGVTISLHAEEGILPEGTELSVTEVTDALGDTIKEKMDSEAEGTTVHSVLAYDINLLYNGKKLSNSWSESGYVDVTFTGAPIQEMTEASDKVEIVAVDDTSKTQLSAENAAEAEAGELKLETVSEQNVEDAAVEEVGFKAEHFTIYAITGSGTSQSAKELKNMLLKKGQSLKIYSSSGTYGSAHRWYSNNSSVASVSANESYNGYDSTTLKVGNGNGTATITLYNGRTMIDQAKISVGTSTVSAQFYYLKDPTKNADSNSTTEWSGNLGTGTVDEANAVWTDNKNIYNDTAIRVISWPSGLGEAQSDGSLKVTRNSEYWNDIFDNFKSATAEELKLQNLRASDVTAIYLVPYKISKNNGTYPDHHVDCNVRLDVNDVYTVNYYLKNAGLNTSYQKAEDGHFVTKDSLAPAPIGDYPSTKQANGVTYKFVGWYDNEHLTGSPVDFNTYTVTRNVDFYAKYVGGYNVIYNLNGGTWNIGTEYPYDEGSLVTVVDKVPTKTGYTFTGWTCSEKAHLTHSAKDTFIMPSHNVTLTAQWVEAPNVTLNYKALTGGSVDITSEAVAPVTGKPQGSTAIAAAGYKFVGWYSKSTCAENSKVDNAAKFVPEKNSNESWIDGTTWYAKFEIDKNQKFGYTVNYYIKGTSTKVPGIGPNPATGSGYLGENVLVSHPSSDQGYKVCADQPTGLTVSANATNNVVNVYYEIDENQKFGYTINYYIKGTSTKVPGINPNPVTGSGYLEQKIDVSHPRSDQGYVVCTDQPTGLTVSANSADNVVNVYYEKGMFTYEVHYYYENGETVEEKFDEEVRETAILESEILFDSTISKQYNGHTYAYDRFEAENYNGENGKPIVTPDATKNIVRVYYAIDELGNNPEDPTNPNKPDEIPDKYQLVFTYVAEDHGTVTGIVKEVVTRYEGDKKFSTTAPAYPRAEVIATPDNGYNFVNWTSDNPSEASKNIVSVLSRVLQRSSATNAEFADVDAIRSAGFTKDTEFTAHFIASDATTYKVEVYYEHEGKYSTVPSKTETLAGTTDTKATVAAETYLPTSGYVFDQNAGNVLEGTIAGDNSLVLKVYYKQVFKVTYAPGDHGSFKSQTYTVSYGDQTPEFSGDKTVNGNYRFTGWDKTIESQVTADVVYTALWTYSGGGNGGGGGGSSSGGGGGSSSGPRDNGSTPSGGPGTTTVTIDPDAVPLANLPNEDGADNLLMIDDEDVPLAALPKTGQSGTNGLVFFLSSMMLAAFVAVTKKREDDK